MITLVTDAHNHASARPAARSPPQAWEALQYALARRAIQFVSGPGALASALRRSLLDGPLNGKSVILDIGYSNTIPESIRKAVIARDKGCAWPGGCDRRPAACDVHHVKHKKHGGKTSTSDCVMLCQYHHDICIHRWGWEIELLPDGSTRATSPDKQTVLRSHGPPPTTQPAVEHPTWLVSDRADANPPPRAKSCTWPTRSTRSARMATAERRTITRSSPMRPHSIYRKACRFTASVTAPCPPGRSRAAS